MSGRAAGWRCSLCFIIQIFCALRFQQSARLDRRSQRHCAGSGRVLWGAAFVLRERDEVRFDIIYSALAERARRVFTVITGIARHRPVRHRAARRRQLRDVHEGRAVGLSRYPPRLAVFHLRRVLGGRASCRYCCAGVSRCAVGAEIVRRPDPRQGRRLTSAQPVCDLHHRHLLARHCSACRSAIR